MRQPLSAFRWAADLVRDLFRVTIGRTNRTRAALHCWAKGPHESSLAVTAGLVWMLSPPVFVAAAIFDALRGGDDAVALIISGLAVGLFGAVTVRLCRLEAQLTVRQTLTALVVSVLSAIGVVMVAHFATGTVAFGSWDVALVEAAATVTATNASTLEVSQISEGMLAFRSLGQWLSGAGFVIMLVGVMQHLGVGGLDADGGVATRSARRLAPRQAENITRLLLLYSLLTLLVGVAYAVAGMPVVDAGLHALTTISTGGFSSQAASIGYYGSAIIEWVAIVGMIVGGTSLPLMFLAIRRADPLRLFRSYEFGAYIGLISVCSVWLMMFGPQVASDSGRLSTTAVRHAIFMSASAASTTGFSVTDISALASAGAVALVAVMLVGGMSASMSGGFKGVRLLTLLSYVRRELRRATHPGLAVAIHLRNSTVSEKTVSRIAGELLLAALLAVPAVVLLSASGLDPEGAWSFVVSLMSNVGPALGAAGPDGHLQVLGVVGRLTSATLMLMGRVSITAVAVALSVLIYPATSTVLYRLRSTKMDTHA